MKPKKQCNKPGCRELVAYNIRYCNRHTSSEGQQVYADRVAVDERYLQFYNSKRWRTLSKLYRINNPICENCFKNGIVRKADVVDHIVEVKDCWDKRLDETNLQSLCHTCHNAKTQREKKRRRREP